jgi:hypothetical protein
MRDTEYKLLEPVADAINSKFEELLNTGEFAEIQEILREAVDKLPENYSLNFNIELSVFDKDRQKDIKLLQTGLTTSGGEPYQHSADTTPQKYIVDGEMYMIPEEFCPHCWGQWMFKFKHNQCGSCGYELGKQVKYLLDDDVCPMCQTGNVTIENPVCADCGYEVEVAKVVWG